MKQLELRRLGYALGAEISGLNLSESLDDEIIAQIKRAWFEHILLCFPGQELTPEGQMAFCARFGALDDYRSRPEMRRPDHPCVALIANKPVVVAGKQFKGVMADEWHTDTAFSRRPATGTFLFAKELPEVGGDTMFSNTYMAYETLSPAFQRMIDPLEAIYDVRISPIFSRQSPELQAERFRRDPLIVHPVVRIHPETGRKAICVGNLISRFVGMTAAETKPILQFLMAHATRYEFVYRHRWRVGDLLLWDNRCAMHYAVADYDLSQLRNMQRCSLLPPESGRLYIEENDEPVVALAGSPS